MKIKMSIFVVILALVFAGCGDDDGHSGHDHSADTHAGHTAGDGTDGTDGADGTDGTDGADGTDGTDGADGTDGTDGTAKLADIVETATAAGSFETMLKAVTAAGMVDTLKGAGPFTVFAPTDDAFGKLDQAVIGAALADPKGLLTDILKYHVVDGKVMAADVVKLTSAKTLGGQEITIEVKGDAVILNGTVKVTKTDIECTNGVIHVIDAVLMPPKDDTPKLADIVDTAVAAGSFGTLADALTKAGLVDTLKGEGPFTVFAPNDDAFKALDKATLDTALADPKGLLTNVLKYHVVSGKVLAADVVKLDGKTAKTLLGEDIAIKLDGDKVMLNDKIQVITTDIECTNGVIHVIDGVLLPPSK